MKAHAQQAFTLIELMIVIAIVGILSAVATLQYQSYVSRAYFAVGLNSLSAIKRQVEIYSIESGDFPTELSAVAAGIRTPSSDLGELSFEASEQGAAAGRIVFTFNKGVGLKGARIMLNRNTAGVWHCTSNANKIHIIAGCSYQQD